MGAAAYGHRFSGAPNYAPTSSLSITTYDGGTEPTEPKIIAKPSWVTATCTHILSFNPLTGGSDDVENPSLMISNDNGATWSVPAGLTNPIAGKPTAPGAQGHNSDCAIFADPVVNRLVMLWQVEAVPAGQGTNGVWYSICTDPALATWGAATLLVASGTGAASEPKIVYDVPRSRYCLFTIDLTGSSPYKLYMQTSASSPVSGYGSRVQLTIPGAVDGQTWWHMDVIQEPSGRFVMALMALSGKIYLASSWDGLTWNVAPRPVMGQNAWSVTGGMYRPSIMRAASGTGYDFVVSRSQNPGVSPGGAKLGRTVNVPATEVP